MASSRDSKLIVVCCGIPAVLGILFCVCFFRAVLSTTAECTGSGFIWPVQVYFNFLHGRPFQSSLFATPSGGGSSVGFIANPYGFINTNVIHVNWLPYLFAPLWGLHPTPAWLYGIEILWCWLASSFFTVSILKRLDPTAWKTKSVFALAILISGGLLSIIAAMAQFLVFAGPLMLAVYDAALSRRKGAFFFWFIALCLVSEDAAMVALMFGLYFFVFESEHRRLGALGAGFAVLYLAFILKVLQPASRAELTVIQSTTTRTVIDRIFQLGPANLAWNVYTMMPVFTFIPAVGLAGVLFGRLSTSNWRRLGGVALVPSFLHWGECLFIGTGHHLIPPFFGLYLALLLFIASRGVAQVRLGAAFGWILALELMTVRACGTILPPELKLPFLQFLRPAQAEALSRSLKNEKESNLRIIAEVHSIPVEDSLCFLGNIRPSGYLYARSDVWEFPDYYKDTRYILIQKDAIDANVGGFTPREGETLESIVPRIRHGEPREFVLPLAAWMLVRRTLVDKERTHRVVREDDRILLLENLNPRTPFSAPSTYGWGWIRNIGHKRTFAAVQVKIRRPSAIPGAAIGA